MTRGPLTKLTDQHFHFIECYLMHFNAARAAVDAGYSIGSRDYGNWLLTDRLIKKHLRKRSAEIMSEIHEEQLKVFREMMNLATSDIRQLYNPNGSLKPMDEWPDDIAKCVSSVKLKVQGKGILKKKSLEVKLWSKNQAQEVLCRVLGLVSSDVNINLPLNVGAIYFPHPKEAGAPVDPKVIAQDQKVHLLQAGDQDHGEKDR